MQQSAVPRGWKAWLCLLIVLAILLVVAIRRARRESPGAREGEAGVAGQPMALQQPSDSPVTRSQGADHEGLPDPLNDISFAESLVDDLIADFGRPPELSVMMERWTADEEARIQQISSEDFDQTLAATVDWESNYFKLVLDADPRPSLPSSLKLIVYSRRFAKLLEETRSGLTGRQIAATVSRLQDDLLRWKELVSSGQSLVGGQALVRVDRDSAELIVPLTIRINATILFMGERTAHPGLPAILESVDTLGNHTNWSAVGYACDKIMSSMPREGLSQEQLAVLASYATWKKKSEHGKFFQYTVAELPSFRSPRRPFERATSLGAEVDLSHGTITVEFPPMYTVVVLLERAGGGYYDPSGQNVVAQQVVEYARQFCSAPE